MRALVCALLLLATTTPRVWAAEQQTLYQRADVEWFISAYAAWYANEAWPYDVLVARTTRVAACESGGFSSDVINNVRRGRFGEIGVGQWMPGPRAIWQSTPQAQAGYSVLDPEANTAGLVWAISQGLGPRHWSCWGAG